MDFYNGYSPQERNRKLRALHKAFPKRSHPYYKGPCHMCSDPESPVAPHGEDYSEPYCWDRPAVYALCATCHGRLHKRFKSPFSWEAYKRHLRRGGYGSDLRKPPVARQVAKLAKSLEAGVPFELLNPLDQRSPPERSSWWESLNSDPASLAAAWARIR
jgi:hypothetical protein